MAMERAFQGRPGSLPWEGWSQFGACEEPVAVIGAQICIPSSLLVVCRGLKCTDRSQSLPQWPWSVPFQAGLDLSLGRVGASSGPVRSQWRMPALVLKQGLDLELGLDLCLGLDLEMLTEPEPMHVHRRRAEKVN